MSDMLQVIFDMQANLQRKIRANAGQCDIADQTVAQRVEAIKGNVFALEHELHELIDEMKWKDWTRGDPFINRDAAVKEGIDALHFLINIFLHLDVTPLEIYTAYTAKNAINHTRQDDGYDGVGTKCKNCGRALEDVSIMELHGDDGVKSYLCVCGVALPVNVARQFISD